MKKYWTTEELQRFWAVSSEEKVLINIKIGIQKFFFVLTLKYYKHYGSFPNNSEAIPYDLLNYGYNQFGINVSSEELKNLFLNTRNYNRYKLEIRDFLGVSLLKGNTHKKVLIHLHKLVFETRKEEKLKAELKLYLKQHKIELPTNEVMDNLIKTALNKFDNDLFTYINAKITQKHKVYIDKTLLLKDTLTDETLLSLLKQDSGKSNRDSIAVEIDKLAIITPLSLNNSIIPENVSQDVLRFYKRKILSDTPEQIRARPENIRYPLIIIYCYLKQQDILDNLTDHLVNFIHKVKKTENKVESKLNSEIDKLSNVTDSLYQVAEVALERPMSIIQDAIYPVVSKEQIEAIIKARYLFKGLKQNVQSKVIKNYCTYYRKRIFDILANLDIKSKNTQLLLALELIKKYKNKKIEVYPTNETVAIDGLINAKEMEFICKIGDDKKVIVSRKDYEYAIFKVLRDKLKTKEAWIVGAFKYRDPECDIPKYFDDNKEYYYGILNQPLSVNEFNKSLKNKLSSAIINFDINLPKNKYVEITKRKNKPWIKLTPSPEQAKPLNLDKLKDSIIAKWKVISLLDVLKEVDLRENITNCFNSSGNREIISREEIQKRLILCLFGIGE